MKQQIIEVLDSEKKLKILSEIPKKDRLFIEDNLSYDENTAGRLMQKEVVKIPFDFDVGNTIDFLRKSNSYLQFSMTYSWLMVMIDLLGPFL